MIKGKDAYLKKVSSKVYMRSLDVGKEIEGSTPPSVFVGSWNYPKVFAGPLLSQLHGDTTILDTPESWIPNGVGQEDIIKYRMGLVRGKQPIKVTDLDCRYISKLRDIALTRTSIESQAEFDRPPKGVTFNDHHSPFGPSGLLERLEIENTRWDQHMEKTFYDGDLRASNAVFNLYKSGVPFTNIQKSFSLGCFGMAKRRRLVPTRWSITACDSTISRALLSRVRNYDVIDTCRLHEFYSLNNYYAVLLLPTYWQYEWTEAFLHLINREEMIFSDHEGHLGKTTYSSVGGCYYACKMAVLESLEANRLQAGALVFREAYKGYVPLGVFNVRENVRNAMKNEPLKFDDMASALRYLTTKLWIPVTSFIKTGALLQELLRSKQTTLSDFVT